MKEGDGRAPALIGWQTLLADLSLILFMVTAAAIASPGMQGMAKAPAAKPRPSDDLPLGEPLAVWRAGGAQSLHHWLSHEQPDRRQQLTITARYRSGTEAVALAAVQALLRQAGAQGAAARVIVTPASDAENAEIFASLAYDRAPGNSNPGMAQGLRDRTAIPSARTQP